MYIQSYHGEGDQEFHPDQIVLGNPIFHNNTETINIYSKSHSVEGNNSPLLFSTSPKKCKLSIDTYRKELGLTHTKDYVLTIYDIENETPCENTSYDVFKFFRDQLTSIYFTIKNRHKIIIKNPSCKFFMNKIPIDIDTILDKTLLCKPVIEMISIEKKLTDVKFNYKIKELSIIENTFENLCPICLTDIKNSVLLPCKHIFCYTCMEQWFCIKHNCPLCRTKIILKEKTLSDFIVKYGK
jgi:hypothetical protein